MHFAETKWAAIEGNVRKFPKLESFVVSYDDSDIIIIDWHDSMWKYYIRLRRH